MNISCNNNKQTTTGQKNAISVTDLITITVCSKDRLIHGKIEMNYKSYNGLSLGTFDDWMTTPVILEES